MALLDIAGDLITSAMDWDRADDAAERANELAKANAADAFYRQQAAYKSRYYYTVKDMERSGLNPILAATGGFNVGNSPSVSTAQTFMAESPRSTKFGTSGLNLSQAEKNRAESEKARNEAVKVIEDTKLITQKTKNEMENILKTRAETKKISAEEQTEYARLEKTQNEFLLLAQQIKTEIQRTGEVEAIRHLRVTEKKKVQSEIKRLNALATQIKAQSARMKQIAKVYDGPLGKYLAHIEATTGILTTAVAYLLGRGIPTRTEIIK